MAEDLFNELVKEEPDRSDSVDEEEIDVRKSASEAETTSPNDSDLESTLKRLNPQFDDVNLQKIAPSIMSGRVFPDNFPTKVYLITTAIAKENRNNPQFNVILTMMQVEGMCQIGLDGKNRVETVIVSGNTKEVAEQESTRMGNF